MSLKPQEKKSAQRVQRNSQQPKKNTRLKPTKSVTQQIVPLGGGKQQNITMEYWTN
jgi:hypothetical protein